LDLSFLFSDPILTIKELSPGYEGHASDVWHVTTLKEEAIVRASRMIDEPSNDFWWGCKRLFGIDPRKVWELEGVNDTLKTYSSIPVPKVLNKGMIDNRQCVVVEKLEGHVLTSLISQPDTILESLGEGLATIHRFQSDYTGHPSGTLHVPLNDFHDHLGTTMSELVEKFYPETEIAHKLPDILSELKHLHQPNHSTLVLIDMDPTQFLTDGVRVTGLVDTEAYALAPIELEFIGLEYILDEKGAKAFKKGYEKILPIPDLTKCRKAYRYLYRLLSVQGKVEIEKWLNHKFLF
jgi:aminoglycoside phosphotransferase (APT) family kinase protein